MDYTFKLMTEKDGRKPTLWIVKGGKIHSFEGKSIPGAVAVRSMRCEKDAGRKPGIVFELKVMDGATACLLIASPHGRLWPEVDATSAYNRFKKQFEVKVSQVVFEAALELHFPLTQERMLLGPWDPWSKRVGN